jgi:hypothetical protein
MGIDDVLGLSGGRSIIILYLDRIPLYGLLSKRRAGKPDTRRSPGLIVAKAVTRLVTAGEIPRSRGQTLKKDGLTTENFGTAAAIEEAARPKKQMPRANLR